AFNVELLYIAQFFKIPVAEDAVNWTEIEALSMCNVSSHLLPKLPWDKPKEFTVWGSCQSDDCRFPFLKIVISYFYIPGPFKTVRSSKNVPFTSAQRPFCLGSDPDSDIYLGPRKPCSSEAMKESVHFPHKGPKLEKKQRLSPASSGPWSSGWVL
ncbi:hypothetical protein STEG23_029811, partial [Scotinomys teguina]